MLLSLVQDIWELWWLILYINLIKLQIYLDIWLNIMSECVCEGVLDEINIWIVTLIREIALSKSIGMI